MSTTKKYVTDEFKNHCRFCNWNSEMEESHDDFAYNQFENECEYIWEVHSEQDLIIEEENNKKLLEKQREKENKPLTNKEIKLNSFDFETRKELILYIPDLDVLREDDVEWEEVGRITDKPIKKLSGFYSYNYPLNESYSNLHYYIVTGIKLPFKDKDELKLLKVAKWCPEKLTWYIIGKTKYEKLKQYIIENKKNWEFTNFI